MIWLVLTYARLLELGPVEASIAGARIAGVPGLASELLDLCESESTCRAIGVHRGRVRRKPGRVFHAAAREAGLLSDCPAHALERIIPEPPAPTKQAPLAAQTQQRRKSSKHRGRARLENIPPPAPGDRWGIRGAHGLAAAYSVHLLGECVPPEAIDVPLLSAIVAAKRLRILSTRYRRRTAEARAHAWRHGVGCRCEQFGAAE